jgi:CotH kinase protein
MANFYLYRPVASNVHRLIAWDRDTTFQQIDAPIFARASENALVSRALRFSDLRTLYLDVLEQCARAAAQDRWLEAEIYQAHQLISDAVYEDRAKPSSNEDYEAAVAHLMSFAQQRPAFVLNEVANAR